MTLVRTDSLYDSNKCSKSLYYNPLTARGIVVCSAPTPLVTTYVTHPLDQLLYVSAWSTTQNKSKYIVGNCQTVIVDWFSTGVLVAFRQYLISYWPNWTEAILIPLLSTHTYKSKFRIGLAWECVRQCITLQWNSSHSDQLECWLVRCKFIPPNLTQYECIIEHCDRTNNIYFANISVGFQNVVSNWIKKVACFGFMPGILQMSQCRKVTTTHMLSPVEYTIKKATIWCRVLKPACTSTWGLSMAGGTGDKP